jgi:hypothetical protein
MAKPVGLKTTLKDNSKKLYRNHTEWMKGKRLGRPKQQWVFEEPMAVAAGEQPSGHWEKVQ